MRPEHSCKECRADPPPRVRPAPHPGPRCATHHRAFRQAAATRARHRYVERTYGITGEMYDRLGEWQGWRCYVCGVADGTRKALAVHHSHLTGEVLALLCGPDNQVEGRWRGQPGAAERMMHVSSRAGPDLLAKAPARLAWARTQRSDGSWTYANQLPVPAPRPSPENISSQLTPRDDPQPERDSRFVIIEDDSVDEITSA